MFDKVYKKEDLLLFCKLAKLECSSSQTKSDLANEIKDYLKEYKFPPRYLRNLSEQEKWLKKFEIRFNLLKEKYGKISKKEIYQPIKSDLLYKSPIKTSKYTEEWNKKYPDCKDLKCKSKVSGVNINILNQVENKGAAAWRGGSHRPGASRENWMVSRVNSFLLCGKTWEFPDHLLAKEALKSPKVQRFWKSCKKSKLGKRTPSR
jgi:hypothetical protein